jgi:hypothetical protein
MLGWAQFTEAHPTRTIEFPPDNEYGFSGSGTTALQSRINRFQRVIQTCIFEEHLYGGINSMIFSDCAFIDVGNSLRAAVTAVGLMRSFIKVGVPVRMGLGKGTYYTFKFGMETNGESTNANLSFAGTAVVWSHQAEQCGGKGMRIFLHPSAREDYTLIRQRVRILDLEQPSVRGIGELDYMQNQDHERDDAKVEEQEQFLCGSAWSIKPTGATPEVEIHYTETLNAMNRMRKARGKAAITAPQWVPGLGDS